MDFATGQNTAESVSLRAYIFSCSLHLPGWTKPFRPFGYVLRTENNSIIASYAKDVSSELISGKKLISRKIYNYQDDFVGLVAATPKGKHNEVVLDVNFVEIHGYYGSHKKFSQVCKSNGLIFYDL
jgi:hypothetical protein